MFTSFDEAAEYIAEFYHPHIKMFFVNGDHPYELIVDKKISKDTVHLTVYYAAGNSPEEMKCNRIVTVDLPRLAGHIGYGTPKVFCQSFTSRTSKTLKSLGVDYV